MAVRLVQITDPHVGAEWAAADPLGTLAAVLGAVRALPDRVDGLLVTGDLAAAGRDAEYAALASVLAECDLPLCVLPGNHDDRAGLRRHFPVGGDGEAGDAIQYVAWFGALRVLMLDTTVPGQDAGALGALRLTWIEERLRAGPEDPTLLAMHHPPVLSGIHDTDRYALAATDRAAVAEIVAAHPQVCGIIAGHVHRTMIAGVGGRPVLTAPSTYCQFPLDAEVARLTPVPEPVGFAVHTLIDGRLVSHVQTLPVTAAG